MRETTLAKDRSEKTSSTYQMDAGIGVAHHLALAAKKKKRERRIKMSSLELGDWKCQLCTMMAPSISQLTPHSRLKAPLTSMA